MKRSKKKKKIIFIIPFIIIILLFIIYILMWHNNFTINLNGEKSITIEVNNEYLDEGATLIINKEEKNELLTIKNNVDTSKLGTYNIIYQYKNKKVVRTVSVIDSNKPIITLKGNNPYTIYQEEEYVEPGYEVSDNYDSEISEKIKVSNNIDLLTPGNYEVIYEVTDSSGNYTKVIREIIVNKKVAIDDYLIYDNTTKEWGFTQNNDHLRPTNAGNIDYYKKYNAYYLGNDEKIIYLTFDEGGNPVTYVDEIVDILNKYDIKATFFFCHNYILNNKQLILKIDESGHNIGNHTVHHIPMPTFATSDRYNEFIDEIKQVEDAYHEVTNKSMLKLFRYPNGAFSERTLNLLNDMGYKTIFWSFFYNDWQKDTTKEYALDLMKNRLHNGAIYLIHAKNKGNMEALEDFINYAKDNGYSFGLVNDL